MSKTAPTKCPKCGAEVWMYHNETIWFFGSSEVEQSSECVAMERDQLAERVKRLEEAGDAIVENGSASEGLVDAWRKAKEAKP